MSFRPIALVGMVILTLVSTGNRHIARVARAEGGGDRLDVPITVTAQNGVSRSGEPVSLGIPLPESLNIVNPGDLGIQDSRGRWIPAQFAVLSRWGGAPDSTGPLKWVLADFQADVQSGRGATYHLRTGAPATGPSELTVRTMSGRLVVSTGKIAFEMVPGGTALLENVRRLPASGASESVLAGSLSPELAVAAIIMVGRMASKGDRVLPVSSVNGLSVGDSIEIQHPTVAQVALPREGKDFADRFPLANRRGGRFLRITPYPSAGRYPGGAKVTVAEGAPNEETVTVSGVNPDFNILSLSAPLRFDHQAYETTLTSRSSFAKIARILDAHRIAVESAFDQDEWMGGLVMRKGVNGAPLVFRPKVTEGPVIEEAGPVKVTIRVRGRFEEQEGRPLMGGEVEFTARITAYAGTEYLKLTFTLENNGPYGFDSDEAGDNNPIASWLFLRHLTLHLPVPLTAPITALTESPVNRASVSQEISLFQEHRLTGRIEKGNFFFRVTQDGKAKEHAGRLSGWLDVSDRSRGITVAVRDFWQNYPKELSYRGGRLSIGLWPAGSHYPDAFPGEMLASRFGYYAFEGGRHKTHEIYLRFHGAPSEGPSAADFARSASVPLIAVIPGSWYAASKALGMLAPARMPLADQKIAEAVARYEKFHRAFVHADQAEDPRVTIHMVREKDPSARYYGEELYGWMNFGDLPWEEGYSSLHYDWPYGVLLQFIRTGDPAFFVLGREMALHRIDIDHIHGNKGHRGKNPWKSQYLQRYETDFHGNAFAERPRDAHTWSGGMALYYLLTGDRHGLEATLEVAEAAREYWKWVLTTKTPMAFHEIRRQGWSLLNLLHAYRITGDRRDLEMATALFRNSLLHLEQLSGGKGYWAHEGDITHARPVETAFVLDPLIQLHHETKDAEILALLQRVADWSRQEIILGGDTKGGNYRPLGIPYVWRQGQPPGGAEPVRNLFFADLFAYLHLQSGAPEHLTTARRLFRDAAFWFTYGDEYVWPSARSPVSYTVKRFNRTETKIGAWFAKYPQTYLYAEWRLLTHDEKESNP